MKRLKYRKKKKQGLITSKKFHSLSYVNNRINTCYDVYKELHDFKTFKCERDFVGFEVAERNTKIYEIRKQKLNRELSILEKIKDKLENEN